MVHLITDITIEKMEITKDSGTFVFKRLGAKIGKTYRPSKIDYSYLSFENPLMYRGYNIYPDNRGPAGHCWSFVHPDYDGAPDAKDRRHGTGKDVQHCANQINELIEEYA